jgi:SAM-dependent methyltransferase
LQSHSEGYSRANPNFATMVTLTGNLEIPAGKCPCCGHEDWKPTGQVKDLSITGEWFDMLECSICHLKKTYPQPIPEEIGRYYASTDYVSHSDTRKGLINKLYHTARNFMLGKKLKWVEQSSGRKTGHLLDVGTGTGHFAHFMQQHGWTVSALEPDSSARKVAAEKLGLIVEPLEKLATFNPASFDVITLWHVLEHVHDLEGYVDHFRSILRQDGTLIIAVPNHTSPDAQKYGAKWAAYDVPRHLWHFSPVSMKTLFDRHGFTLKRKLPMHLDAFYVSMLSEKYLGHYTMAAVNGFFSGMKTYFSAKKSADNSSSIIYIAQPSTPKGN